jgi:hypothetical protein
MWSPVTPVIKPKASIHSNREHFFWTLTSSVQRLNWCTLKRSSVDLQRLVQKLRKCTHQLNRRYQGDNTRLTSVSTFSDSFFSNGSIRLVGYISAPMTLIQLSRESEHFTHIQEHWKHLELHSYTCNQAKISRIKQMPIDWGGVALCINSWWLDPTQVSAKTYYSWWLSALRRSWWSEWPSELANLLWKPEGDLGDLIHDLISTMPEMVNGDS